MIMFTYVNKYIDIGNPIISIQIGGILVSYVLIDLGVTINVMTQQTMEHLGMTHIYPTPTILELVDQSIIKLECVLDDMIISKYSWEYPTDFIFLQSKNPIGDTLQFLDGHG